MAPAASMNHVTRNRIIELLGFAVALLLWFPCVLAGVDSEDVNLSMEEMDGLQALRGAFNVSTPDPDKTLYNWNSSHPCGYSSPDIDGRMDASAWMGPTCHFHNDINYTWVDGVTVTELKLGDIGLVGVVPPEVSKLRNLERISLFNNSLSGNFPFTSLINTSKMTVLDLSNNNFDGTIPEDAFQNLGQLQKLNLSLNNFTGQAPDVSNLSKLKYLYLSGNKFTGQGPDVSNLSQLSSLSLSRNNFTGQGPDVSNLSHLSSLDLSDNKYTGQGPDVSTLSQLSSLYLSTNNFTGQGPDIFNLSKLEHLELSDNQFTGQGPDVSKLSQLSSLYLSRNNFTGQAPDVSNLSKLEYLELSDNKFTGQGPDVSKLSQLSSLSLSGNKFTGQGPDVSKLSHLSSLDLSNNKYTGQGPDVSTLSQLSSLSLSGNEFTGQGPDVSNLSQLSSLSLSDNKFTGQGPDVSKLSQLSSLYLSTNNFTGPAPDVSNLSKLEHLELSDNQFTGQGPDVSKLSQLSSLYLSRNNFTGQAPDVSNLSKLEYLYLSDNKFTGQAPDVSKLSQLSSLYLSRNNFTGQAPDVSNLSKLEYLDLSDNKFTGQGPDVSNLSQLSSLNMSLNTFTGQAPNLSQLTRLTDLDLSSNNFTGSLPEIPPYASLRHVNISKNKLTGSVSSLVSSLAGASDLTSLDISNNKLGGPLPDLSDLSNLETLNLSSNEIIGLSNNVTFFLSTLPQKLDVLDISNLDIGGPIPHWANSNISQLQLSELYLDKNRFNGTLNILAFAESNVSKSLKVLSLKDNMFTDVVTSEGLVIETGLTKINLQGNPYCNKRWTSEDDSRRCTFYCGQPCIYLPPKSNNMDWKVITMVTSISSAVVVSVILGFAVILRRKQKHIRDLQKKIKEADINAKRFEYSELRVATKNFASEMKLGDGAYGAVYKGVLGNNLEVAVKQLFLETNKGRDDFLNEVLLISNLQHRNLVTLKGYCLHGKQTLLVYEYVDNCDLDKLLLCRHRSTDCTSEDMQPVLNWQARLNVCQGVAHGLYYLHASSQSRIIHRDIKASNILLDKNLQPKIADFGLARPIEDARSVIMTQQCAGTLGYLAPEYMCHGQLSDKADVYSFGVLLLEIVSGKRNRDLSMPEDEVYLPNWAWKLHKESRLLDMKDPSLVLGENEGEEVQRVLETAVLCVQNAPEKRPSMFLAAAMLAGQANVDALPPADEIQYESWLQGITLEECSDDGTTMLMSSSASNPACT